MMLRAPGLDAFCWEDTGFPSSDDTLLLCEVDAVEVYNTGPSPRAESLGFPNSIQVHSGGVAIYYVNDGATARPPAREHAGAHFDCRSLHHQDPVYADTASSRKIPGTLVCDVFLTFWGTCVDKAERTAILHISRQEIWRSVLLILFLTSA